MYTMKPIAERERVPNKMLVHSEKPLLRLSVYVCVYMSSCIVPAAAAALFLLRFLSLQSLATI